MYLDFFKFKKNPFHITPDPDFLFLSPSHREASASIFYGIEERKGFVAVTGEVGVGKTTILRSYLEGTDPEKIKIVYMFNAALSFDRLLKQIVSELGVQSVDGDPPELIDSLFRYLIDEYEKDRIVVLIIDEAQNMPVETLERLRMLSNLETSQDKLLQIILVGQPEFEDRLNLPELRQLKQRIAIRCRIAPLTPDESLAYIQHRLMKASLFHNPVFTKGALKRIVKEANGIPRIINILCDNALITAFGYQRNPVDDKIVKEVIGDFQGGQPGASFNWKVVWVPALVVLIGLAVYAWRDFLTSERIRTLERGIFSAGVSDPAPVAGTVKQPQEIKPDVDSPPQAELGPGVAEIKPGVDSPPQVELGPGAAYVKPAVVSPPQAESGPAVAEVKPAADSPPAVAPGPAVPVVKSAAEIASGARPEPALPEAGATGDKGVLEKGPENRASPAQLSVKPQAAPGPLENRSPQRSSHILVVKKGDTVSRLLMGSGGRLGGDTLRAFKDLNPRVTNMDKIREGEKLAIPEMK